MDCSCPVGKARRKPNCSPDPLALLPCETLREVEEARRRHGLCDCAEDKCGLLPRRVPLLGIVDHPCEKSKRAFQVQAEQGIWDVGRPISSWTQLPFRRSRFRDRYERGLYPFQIDHSGDVSLLKIAWCVDIDQYDITDLMKDTLEAQSDIPHWAHLGHLVYMDLLKHVAPIKLATALPSFSAEFRKMMRRSKLLNLHVRISQFQQLLKNYCLHFCARG